eukprot:jgi/Ulvmu1/6380/UM003_0008.1
MTEEHYASLCELCHQRADVWCRQDRAYLCARCDQDVHSAGPLAWKHERTRLPGRLAFLQTSEANAETRGARPNSIGEQACQASRFDTRWSNTRVTNYIDCEGLTSTGLQAASVAPGFESAQLCGEDDILNPVRDPFVPQPFQQPQGLEHWPGAVGRSDTSTSEPVEQAKLTESPSPLARTTSSQHLSAGPFSSGPPCSAPGPQMSSEPPDVYPDPICARRTCSAARGAQIISDAAVASASTVPPPGMHAQVAPTQEVSAAAAPAFCGLPVASPAMQMPGQFAGAVMPMVPMHMQAPWPYYTMPHAGWAPCVAHAAAWATYIPASLRPPADSAAREAQLRQRRQRYKRFYQKKQQISSGRSTVKYVERKKFADARPRLHGRFIPKALLPCAAVTAAAGEAVAGAV